MAALPEILAEREVSEYELERGKPMPSTNHAFIQDNISFQFNLRYRKDYKLMPELSLDTPGKGTVPDIAIYPKFDIDFRHDIIKNAEPPLVTIEILSFEQKLQDLVDKTYRYFDFGVKSCWIVLPSLKTIMVYSGVDDFEYVKEDTLLHDPNTGFELPLNEIFG